MEIDLLAFKAGSAAAMIAIAVVGGLVPLLAARAASSQRFFSLGNAFTGGLFLGLGFLHFLPDGIHELEGLVDYPLALLMATVGLGVLLLIDRVILGDPYEEEDLNRQNPRAFYPYLLMALLSVHSFIVGVSLGLEEHLVAAVVIVVGVLVHKGSETFALMVSTHTAGLTRSAQKAILGSFAVMTPAGIAVGLLATTALGENDVAKAWAIGIFNSFAAGTFIYLAIADMIDAELARRDVRVAEFVMSVITGDDDVPMPTKDGDRWLKFLLIIAGVALIAVLAEFTHVPHSVAVPHAH